MARFAEPADLAIQLENVEILERVHGRRQDLSLLLHPKLGRVLVINNLVQHAEAWQALYHEPLVHLPASFVRELGTAVVLGGGSLFAARELFRYPSLTSCTLVDHDPAVLELMARHYEHARAVLADRRFHFVEGDAFEFMAKTRDRFDLVVNDCIDLLTDGLETPFGLLGSRASAEGVCSDVIYRDLLENEYLARTRADLAALGPTALSLVTAPEFPGVLHALTIWGSPHVNQAARAPRNLVQQAWCSNGRPDLEFYDPRFLAFHLHVPPILRRAWLSGS